ADSRIAAPKGTSSGTLGEGGQANQADIDHSCRSSHGGLLWNRPPAPSGRGDEAATSGPLAHRGGHGASILVRAV
ncbi:MAG: hypothetical protein AVDCRST_MAG87-2332, partial [uncultured Thermomicrobiales bacterium]